MLAQTFKTSEDLGISDTEHRALATVLGMLERGEISEENFAMNKWDCGKTACLCGWARRVSGVDDMFDEGSNPAILELFGWKSPAALQCREPEKAAMALRSYLTTGWAHWAKALES